MNADVLPTFEEHGGKVETVLSDNGREFCGRPDQHPYELFLQLEDIDHRTTWVKRPQSNGIVERFHRTVLDEHFPRRRPPHLVRDHRGDADRPRRLARDHRHRSLASGSRHEWLRTPIRAFTDGLPKPDTKGEPQTKPTRPASLQNRRRLTVVTARRCQANTLSVHIFDIFIRA